MAYFFFKIFVLNWCTDSRRTCQAAKDAFNAPQNSRTRCECPFSYRHESHPSIFSEYICFSCLLFVSIVLESVDLYLKCLEMLCGSSLRLILWFIMYDEYKGDLHWILTVDNLPLLWCKMYLDLQCWGQSWIAFIIDHLEMLLSSSSLDFQMIYDHFFSAS